MNSNPDSVAPTGTMCSTRSPHASHVWDIPNKFCPGVVGGTCNSSQHSHHLHEKTPGCLGWEPSAPVSASQPSDEELDVNPCDDLYRAVAKYVASHGGEVIVAGGIQVQEWPGGGPYQFTIAVKCTGHRPDFDKGPK